MSRIVAKFGGSSLAEAKQFKKVRAIIEADPRRSIIVPSAPGKRVSSDAKLTDLLYLCQSSAALGTDFSAPFALIRDRFLEIERDLGLPPKMGAHLEKLHDELSKGVTKDYVASRGEYLNGLLLAAYLNAVFIDPQECVILTHNGGIDIDFPITVRGRISDMRRRIDTTIGSGGAPLRVRTVNGGVSIARR